MLLKRLHIKRFRALGTDLRLRVDLRTECDFIEPISPVANNRILRCQKLLLEAVQNCYSKIWKSNSALETKMMNLTCESEDNRVVILIQLIGTRSLTFHHNATRFTRKNMRQNREKFKFKIVTVNLTTIE